MPSCTATATSASSTVPAVPMRLVEEAISLGLHGLAITDHDGFYGAPLFAEIAQKYESETLLTVYGAELSIGLSGPQNGVADPEGSHLLVLARGVEGYHRLAGAMTEAHFRGDEKGRPVYDLDELAEMGRDHWMVLTGCRKGSVRQATRRGWARGRCPGARPADRDVRPRQRRRRADRPRLPDRQRHQRRPAQPWPPITGCRSWRPTTCTTPSRRPISSPPRLRPYERDAASPTWTAGSRPRARRTCAQEPRCTSDSSDSPEPSSAA